MDYVISLQVANMIEKRLSESYCLTESAKNLLGFHANNNNEDLQKLSELLNELTKINIVAANILADLKEGK